MKLQRTSFLLVAGCGACALASHAHADEWTPVSDARLESERGGFDIGDGLKVSFGIERTVIVDGMTQVRNSISIPDVSKITAAQATALAQAFGPTVIANGAGNSVNPVLTQNTAQSAAATSAAITQAAAAASAVQTAASVSPTSVGAANVPTAIGTMPTASLPALTAQSLTVPAFVVQNSLDNQAISATTTINASVNSLRLLDSTQLSNTIQDAVVRFRGN